MKKVNTTETIKNNSKSQNIPQKVTKKSITEVMLEQRLYKRL